MHKLIFVFICLLGVLSGNVNAQKSSQLSTHILDISSGKPAPNVEVQLFKQEVNGNWVLIEKKVTNEQGRIPDFLTTENNSGIYKLVFLIEPYFNSQKIRSFYPYIEVAFQLLDQSHYHVPITLSPFGYSTYRGS